MTDPLLRLPPAPPADAPRAIVFDFGGVLFRWQPAGLVARALPHRAGDAVQAALLARQFFGTPGGGWAEYDRGTIEPEALIERIAGRTGLPADEVRAVVQAVPDELTPLPETVAMLERLHRARQGTPMRLHFLSNMPAPLADHLERSHRFLGCFDGGVFSARVKCIKPDPAIYALCAQGIGLAPERLLFLDDHAPNVEAARALGWQAMRFTEAAACEAELRACGWWPQGPG